MFFFVPSTSWKNVEKDILIIDVREPFEYRQGHAKNTKNIPLAHIDTYYTDQKVYVVCASGSRSKKAVRILRKKGIEAISIRGGMLMYRG